MQVHAFVRLGEPLPGFGSALAEGMPHVQQHQRPLTKNAPEQLVSEH